MWNDLKVEKEWEKRYARRATQTMSYFDSSLFESNWMKWYFIEGLLSVDRSAIFYHLHKKRLLYIYLVFIWIRTNDFFHLPDRQFQWPCTNLPRPWARTLVYRRSPSLLATLSPYYETHQRIGTDQSTREFLPTNSNLVSFSRKYFFFFFFFSFGKVITSSFHKTKNTFNVKCFTTLTIIVCILA